MLILGVDTSTTVCTVALYNGEKILANLALDNGFTHSQTMMVQIEFLLHSANIMPKDLTGIAVSTGPGSFTGLRIGIATAKTMAYALKIPIVGIDTMLSLAYNMPVFNSFLSPLIDGQKGNFYQTIYKWEDKLMQVAPMQLKTYQEALDTLSGFDEKCFLLGDVKNDIVLPENVFLAPKQLIKPCAKSIAILGYERIKQNDIDDMFELEPYYVKKSEAEILWDKKNNANLK